MYFFLFLIILINSCKSDSEKTNESIAGTWVLGSMSYTDSLGNNKTISDCNVSLTFLNDNKQASSNGYEIIDNDTTLFEYSVDYELDCIDIMLKARLDSVKLPLCAIGRMQVYEWYKPNKNTIELSADIEVEYSSTLVLKNTSYFFTKISDLPK